MSKTSLNTIKSALKIDFDTEDEKLQRMTNAAERHICRLTQRSIKSLCEESETGTDLPEDIQQAVIAIVGSWYNLPEATSTFSVNRVTLNLEELISSYYRLSWNPED